jgi:DNA-directed RNA polymerase alpha subunit
MTRESKLPLEVMALYSKSKSNFSERERLVLNKRIGGKTFDEIGKEWGVTRSRIQQIQKKAVEKLLSSKIRKEVEERGVSPSVRDLDAFGLSSRARKALLSLGVKRIDGTSRITKRDLLFTRNCGMNTIKEVERVMGKHGLSLKEEKMEYPPLKINMGSLNLSRKAKQVLHRLNIERIGDLAYLTQNDLLQIRGCGKKTFLEIELFMKNNGMSLRDRK